MASIKAALTFSTADALSYPITLSKSFSGRVDSGHGIRTKVLGIAQGSDAVTIAKANDKTDVAYVYVCNLDTVTENYVNIYVGTTNIIKLAGGEFTFIPGHPDLDFKAYGTQVGQMIEYGVFGVDDTQAKLG